MSGDKEELDTSSGDDVGECPICERRFATTVIEEHVNKCIFLQSENLDSMQSRSGTKSSKTFSIFKSKRSSSEEHQLQSPVRKKSKIDSAIDLTEDEDFQPSASNAKSSLTAKKNPRSGKPITSQAKGKSQPIDSPTPLAEQVRPTDLCDYIGQEHVMQNNSMLRNALEKNDVPSMILWGPPGCGKTTLAHIIAHKCKETKNYRFVKLSATMCGINDVKDVINKAKGDASFRRKTVIFMDEIHRFNKLQQDVFLPHVESGTIILIGATTENPSFSLNSALLSRCRVITLEKLSSESVYKLLVRSLRVYDGIVLEDFNETETDYIPKLMFEKATLDWLAGMCDGDARIALNSLQLAIQSNVEENIEKDSVAKLIKLDKIKDGIKKSHMLYDRKGDQHYDMISALHKSIRASDDNAALYWCARMIAGGEDPRFLCRRMIRAASEDIGLADSNALTVAVNTLHAVQHLGMPESDCIIAQCAVYLARAPKSQETYRALQQCISDIKNYEGPQPAVPLHLRNAPTKLMKELNYGKGYNMLHKDISGLNYLPEELLHLNYFD